MPANAVAYAFTKLGSHRGRKRLWLEGRKLERAGIAPGRKFTASWDRESRRVILDFADEEGDRVVSKRSRNGREMPIIDIGASTLEEALGEGIERTKVTIGRDRIVVEVHPDDAAAQERLDRLVSKVAAGEPLATGSLAHGGGILDHAIHTGLKDAGIEARLAFAVEIDDAILEAAASKNPIWDGNTLQINASMDEIDAAKLPQIDVLVAGLPCTGASKAGKAKNHNEFAEDHAKAGALFIAFLDVVRRTQPAVVLLENVPDYAHTVSASLIRTTLKTWGYAVHETIVEGNEMGALEDRKRLCFVALSPDLGLRLDKLVPLRDKERALGEVLEDIGPDSDLWRPYGHLVAKAARDLEKGNNFKLNILGPEAEKVGALGAGYHKIRPTEAKLRHPTDPSLIRQLTPKEHAAIKTVPQELIDGLGWTLAHTILGNSVIWTAWRSVGKAIGERMNEAAGIRIVEGETVPLANLAGLERLADEAPEEEQAPAPSM